MTTCFECGEIIGHGHPRSPAIMRDPDGNVLDQHIECGFRAIIGGIGHHENHELWCKERHDPDGGRTRRQSALEVWAIYSNPETCPDTVPLTGD